MMEYTTQCEEFSFWFSWRYFYLTVVCSKAAKFGTSKVVRHKKETDVDADDDEEEGEKK